MNSQQSIQFVKKLFEEVYVKGNLNALNEAFDANVKLIDPAAPNFKGGLNELKERETMYKQAFPDKKIKIDNIFAGEDHVIVQWTCTGTHRGELQGIAPTNKHIKITGITLYHFSKNGKISECCQSWDRLGLLEQIGEIQPALALHR